MPQPPIHIETYLSTPLPPLREQFPPGTGGTGPRDEWNEGKLKSVAVIPDFEQAVQSCTSPPLLVLQTAA